jgi:hypothetical protein
MDERTRRVADTTGGARDGQGRRRPLDGLSNSPVRGQAKIDHLERLVPDPFANIAAFAGTTLASPTIALDPQP